MGLVQDEKQPPSVHTGGASMGRVSGSGCWR